MATELQNKKIQDEEEKQADSEVIQPAANTSQTTKVSVELRELLRPLLDWWWALLIVPILSGAIAYYMVQKSPTYYQARVLLNIGPTVKEIKNQTPPLITLRLGSSYGQVVYQDTFLALVAQEANVGLSADEIKQATVVQFTPGTPFFEIHVVDSSATRPLTLLDTMTRLLTSEAPQVRELKRKSQQNFVASRKAKLADLITNLKQKIDNGDSSPPSDSGTDAENAIVKQPTLPPQTQLDAYTEELSELIKITPDSEPNQINIIEQPYLVSGKLGAQPSAAATAMGLVGLSLVVVLVYLLNGLDSRVRRPYHIRFILNWPILLLRKRKLAETNFDMLAAELVSAYHRDAVTVRLMLVHEKRTTGVEETINKLGESLSRLGLNITITVGGIGQTLINESAAEFIQPGTSEVIDNLGEEAVFGEESATGLVSYTPLNSQWELISQEWPAPTRHLTNLGRTCTGSIILCGLNRSHKKSLRTLSEFFITTQLPVAGVVVL